MQILVNSLSVKKIDEFINPDTDCFAHVDRKETASDPTVDLVINFVSNITVTDDCIVIMFENKNWCKISVSLVDYSTIEVM